MNSVTIPVSIGELFDKITILQIKKERIKDANKLANIDKELKFLEIVSIRIDSKSIQNNISELKDINNQLWDIEEAKRNKEKLNKFDEEFIQLARDVYIKNDKRAEIKKQINLITNSSIIEEKSYE